MRRSLLGAVAVVAVVLCVVIQRTRTTELMHVGALTAAQDAQEGLYVEGGSDYSNMPSHRGMFSAHAASKPLDGGVVQSNALPAGQTAGRARSKSQYAVAQDALSSSEKTARSSEGQHLTDEYDTAESTQSKLALRDAELEDAADKGATNLLDSYNNAVNGAVDDYSKMSQKVDARSARAFEGLPEGSGAQANVKKSANGQQRAAAPRTNSVEPGDPLADQKNVFNSLGVTGSLYGVPREYRGDVDATGGARSVHSRVPTYVRRAAHEAADASYIRERAVPERPKSAGPPQRYLDNVQKQAKAPLLKAVHGQSLKQIINSAVKSALSKQPTNPGLSSFMNEESRDRAEDKAHPMGLTENTFHPARSTTTLTQLPPRRARVSRRRRTAARSDDDAQTQSLSSDPAAPLNALELPGVSSHQVQAEAFRSTWNHLDNQIDTIFGPSRAELRRRAARRAARAHRIQEAQRVQRVQQMARVVRGKGALPAAAAQQQVLSAQDASMQAQERKEVEELKNQVKKLKEKAQVRKLKEQVGKLRQQVLTNEQREVLKEEDEDKMHVDAESIKAAFDRVDTEGDEAISVDKVKAALKDLDLNIPDDLLDEVFKAEGIENKDAVDVEGFTDVVNRVQEKLVEDGNTPRVCEDKLRHIFDVFDENHDGSITTEELSEGLSDLGQEVSADEIDALLAKMKKKEGTDKVAEDKEGGVYKADEGKEDEDKEDADVEGEDEESEDDTDVEEQSVSFEEFKNFALREAFFKYDSNDSGFISAEELRSAAKDLGVQITFERAQWLEKQYDQDGNGRMDFDEFKKAWVDFCTERVVPEKKKMWVCDGMGCSWHVLSPKTPEKRGWGWTWHAPTAEEGKKEALDDSKGFWDLLFPWEHTWDSEVTLNKKGQIRAHHDDPHAHLMPHNKYQNAEYPDGEVHVRTQGQKRSGITNEVATHLFADNIVTAAPGFNAGTGRHTRAQQGVDWERNWEDRRESKLGRDDKGSPLVVK